jgi:hypothetical protein
MYRQNVLYNHVCTQLYENSSYSVSENMFNTLNVIVGAHLWSRLTVDRLRVYKNRLGPRRGGGGHRATPPQRNQGNASVLGRWTLFFNFKGTPSRILH